MEAMVISREFWRGRRVLVTGHTGFKGGWLSLWLQSLGAKVAGYALPPASSPSLFELARVSEGVESTIGDVLDCAKLSHAINTFQPTVVFHLAAQSLVRLSYADPVRTYATNVMGTVHVLEVLRSCKGVRAAVIVTSDKCYANRELERGYREDEQIGGDDPYSSSKACAELVTAAYRTSFFGEGLAAIASARAGNVIGGGDWAADRLVPDIMRSAAARHTVKIRNPASVRPWQHVLEPLSGYLLLAQRLVEEGSKFAEAWNFGPGDNDCLPVSWIADRLAAVWGEGLTWEHDSSQHPREAGSLRVDSSKARRRLGWAPRWDLANALDAVAAWYKAHRNGADMRAATLAQVQWYLNEIPG